MRWVALLRGINVGGKNIVPMAALRASFASMGFTDVATLIASGNVVFSAPSTPKPTLTRTIEAALGTTFRTTAKVVVLSDKDLTAVVREAPPGFGQQPTRYRYDVIFVKPPLTTRAALLEVPRKTGVDDVHAGRHALYFRRLTAKATQSRLARIVGMPIYQSLTIRTWTTTTKLLALASAS